jgi:hypothetical protein
MGVVREYAKCTICDCKFIARIGVGVEPTCAHTFDCPNCHTPISVDLKTGEEGAAWVEPRENAEIVAADEGIDLFVNLHPSFAFRAEEYRSKFAFASMTGMELTHGKMRMAGGKWQDFSTQFEVPESQQVWAIVKSVLVLALKSDPGNILQKQIGSYESARRKYLPSFNCSTAFKCVASFFDDVFYPAIGNLRSPLRAFVRASHQSCSSADSARAQTRSGAKPPRSK